MTYAAEKRDARAPRELWIIYLRTSVRHVPDSQEQARRWGLRMAELGGPDEMARYAVSRLDRPGEVPEALEMLKKAARGGSLRAMWELATLYSRGRYAQQDDTQATYWYRRGAEGGDPGAMLLLGMNLQAGFGTARDPAEAVRWFRTAYESGKKSANDEHAAYLLGVAYERGLGVPRDERQAIRWYERVRRTVWVCPAQFRIGRLYELGQGVSKTPGTAFHHYQSGEKADTYGCWALYERLAAVYSQGDLVPKDEKRAEEYSKKAERIKRSYLSDGSDRYLKVKALEYE